MESISYFALFFGMVFKMGIKILLGMFYMTIKQYKTARIRAKNVSAAF